MRAAAGLAFPIAVDVVVPALIVGDRSERFSVGAIRLAGIPLIVAGSWLLIDSVFVRFAREGRGTLVPVDPPRFVVRGGAYRVVRNPMYVANVSVVAGSAVVFGSWPLVFWAVAIFFVFHLFVVLYEEPTLKKAFGDSYERYRDAVPRWFPRLRNPQAR